MVEIIYLLKIRLNLGFIIRMRKYIVILFLFFGICLISQPNNHFKMVAQMIDSIKTVKTVRFKVSAIERINNKYSLAVSENKIYSHPRKVYFLNPEKKLEILFVTGLNNNKAIVKPHIFPYFTLNLDPTGNLMRRNQHYTINELGFEFAGRTIVLALSKEKENLSKTLNYYGIKDKNGLKCHLFVYECKDFVFTEYTVLPKETLSSIAIKLNLNDYMLRTKNDLFNDFGYLKAGTKIQVPTYYCKKAVFYLDEKTMLPISISIFDEIGLFETYDYSNIILNKPFADNEFSKEFKDYHF